MIQGPDWYFAIIFFISILGFVVSAILYFLNKNDTFASRLLAGFLTCTSLLALNFAMMTTNFYLHFPWLWRAFGWASFCFGPFAYLYVRSILEQSYRFKKWDFLWFVPAILHPINLIPFFLLPISQKLAFLSKVITDPKLITLEPEGFLPGGYTFFARILLGVVAIVSQLLLLIKWKRRILNAEDRSDQNTGTYKWLSFLTLVLAIFWGLIITEASFHSFGPQNLNYLIIITISITILFVSLYLLLKPSILYGLKGWLQETDTESVASLSIAKTQVSPIRKQTLSITQGKAYKLALESHLTVNHPYRKPGYTIAHLSQELNIPSHHLSAFINQEYGKNFNELVNDFRVDYLEGLLQSSPDFFQFTLEALGKEAGFNSRAAFIAAVKKKTGKTPSDFFGKRA